MPDKPDKPARKVQPLCAAINDNGHRCSHPVSFHGGKVGSPCKALGCHCTGFVPVEVAIGA